MKHRQSGRHHHAAAIRRALLALSLAALLGGPAAATTAVAAPPENVVGVCNVDVVVDVNPGLSLVKEHLRVTSNGPTGTAACTLTVDGEPVVGTGTFQATANAYGNCVATSGQGEFTIHLTHTPSGAPMDRQISRTFYESSQGLAALLHWEDGRGEPVAVPLDNEVPCVDPIEKVLVDFLIEFIDK